MMLRVAVLVGVLAGARALLPRAPVRRSRLAALQASRRPFIAGNWKLNPETLQDAEGLLAVLAANQRLLESSGGGSLAEVCVFPPACYLSKALAAVQGTGIQVGSQDVSLEASGAFTGEISAKMLRSVGCSYTLAGHSERRSIYEDTDEIVGKKVVAALAAGLKVILCVGETLREYEMELLESVVTLQVKNGLEHVSPADLRENLVIAYEPVWAIGTGLVATPEQAQHAHEVVRAAVASIDAEAAKTIRIQYGGSVTPETIDGLMEKPDVDGALVGGASLVAEKFSRIIDFKPAAAAVQAPRF